MRHQTAEEKKRKKRLRSTETGSERTNPNPEIDEDDIDPAELFDPEEFGVRRKIGPFRL